MERYKEYAWVILEDVVGWVPMMDIPIEDKDLGDIVGGLSVASSDGYIVEYAEAFDWGGCVGMMATRPDQGEALLDFPANDVVNWCC